MLLQYVAKWVDKKESNPIQSNEFRRAQDVLYARIFTIEQLNTTQ